MKLSADLVAQCHRDVADPGAEVEAYDYFTEQDHRAAVDSLLAQRPSGPFWVFAYGSLIWRPEFPHVETRRVVANGWHRAFSMRMTRWRASPEQHGYMMCLDRGGHCEGVALQMPEEGLKEHLFNLLYREVGSHEAMEGVRWIDVSHSDGSFTALTFYAAPDLLADYEANRPMAEIAHALARACGHWGSGAEYVRNTVCHLEDMGIHDDYLWQLQEMVADEILQCKPGLPQSG